MNGIARRIRGRHLLSILGIISADCNMTLEVHVNKATNLTNLEKFGKSDPYVILLFQGVKKKTNYITGSLNPEWNETFVWETGKSPPSPEDSLSIWVKDYERIGRNRLMGETTLLLRNALESNGPIEYELTLYDHNQRPTAATLFLAVTYHKEEKEQGDKSYSKPRITPGSGTAEEATVTNTELLRNDALNVAFTKNKTKYQVRVYVMEARNLIGSNLNPVCQVTMAHLSKQTEVVKSSLNPFWKEIFFFSIECTAADLYTENLEFKVLNSQALRPNMLIGYFRIDLGQVYGQPQHAYLNKWLMLKNDDEGAVSDVTGCLKVSVAVIGPGNEIPDFVGSEEEGDDCESNILLPTGAQLKPASFVFGLYQASDLPRMDPGVMEGVKRILNIEDKRELIDPYMEILFAGNKVSSKVIYGEDAPSWNEKLFLGFQFPSVCRSIRLTLKDWDRVSEDDTIATAHVHVPLISASGPNGFLPCFGPTWVNFYGEPREFALMKTNKRGSTCAEEESCSFRGRVLMSLKTDLGTYPTTRSLPIENDDLLRVQLFCRRRRFKLHATFLNATMVNVIDAPVEFEVSIGNFGNKFEDRFIPSPSATQPTNAVFDGCRYYYLPWKDTKPSVVVTSEWEDIGFRLGTLNMLSQLVQKLESLVEAFSCSRWSAASSVEPSEVENPVSELIDAFLRITDVSLPKAIPGEQKENELDMLLRKWREEELNSLREQAAAISNSVADINDALKQITDMIEEMKHLVFEPQNSIPDVMIWMLNGKKRVAFQRIPAHLVFFSLDQMQKGKDCNKVMTLTLQNPKREHSDSKRLCAAVTVKLWLGLEVNERYWQESQEGAVLTVLAETYENQVNCLGKWTSKAPILTRPSWSDASGTVKLKPDLIVPPEGWQFDGDWFIDPEPSLKYSEDAGRKTFLEDVFENQTRLPGGSWTASSSSWTDIRGDSVIPRDDIDTPSNWEWDDIWHVDMHRAVDEEGWEYAVEATLGGYQPTERTYHLCRRRRWVRLRKLKTDSLLDEPAETVTSEEEEGWEYSTLFNLRFHSKRRQTDLVRRRRWHRKLVPENPLSPLVFKISVDSSESDTDDSKLSHLTCPRLYLTYNESNLIQLRVYIYQARNLNAGDKSGFSDPYACVSFMNQSQKTEVSSATLNPTWDQTLLFDAVTVYGKREDVIREPPSAIMEVYDRDAQGDDEFLGRTVFRPFVHSKKPYASPSLTWNAIKVGKEKAGEILMSSEMFFVDDSPPVEPPKRGGVYVVPTKIRPVLQLSAVEILCWGVRNMKTFELRPVSCPSVEFECGGKALQSKPLKDARDNPNFSDPVLYMEMMLPQEPLFMPAMNIKVRDHRQFGRKPVIGTHAITNLNAYICQPIYSDVCETEKINESQRDSVDTVIDISKETEQETTQSVVTPMDWWAKYYASTGEVSKAGAYLQLEGDLLKIFRTELEAVSLYNGFSDFLNTFHLKRGLSKDLEESVSVGEFKGTFRIYPLPPDPSAPRPQKLLKMLPFAAREEIVVRAYVVKAFNLVPKDSNGKADPYIRIKLGKKEVDNRKNYKANTLSPIFGEVFEIACVLPQEKDLIISLWDYDLLSGDDLIGETVIDLENRYLTKYRATCGLPQSYKTSGLNKWRDSKKPSEILEDVCLLHNLPAPRYHAPMTATIGKKVFSLEDFEKTSLETPGLGHPKERLALHILHTMNIVPEHVETRRLFNPASPDLEQGKIQMWVDMFPKSLGTPGQVVDISPRIPVKFQLRVIIWNTHEVPLDETNAISGDTMSDIYVKCTMSDGCSQKTDVHYRSMDGEGNFNWRMIFPFEYLPAENKIVIKKKKHLWSLDETEHHAPPKITIQIWDNDMFSSDDFLGLLEFSLTSVPLPTKSVNKCGLHQLGIEEGTENGAAKFLQDAPEGKHFNLFEKKRSHGFWPCYTYSQETGYALGGKLEMELEILAEEEAKNKPAGLGRDEPNMNPKLEEPNRPSTSFLWLTSPWKSFKFIIWRNYKWYCLTLFIIFLAVLLVILFIYSFPEAVVYRLVN